MDKKPIPYQNILNIISNQSMANEAITSEVMAKMIKENSKVSVYDKNQDKKRTKHTTIKSSDIIVPSKQKFFTF